MKTLSQIYFPITATPFQNDQNYCEILPCNALKPYIRCFWGTKGVVETSSSIEYGLVIPDTCMDIIFDVNYTQNQINSIFCAFDEHSYRSCFNRQEKNRVSTFAIRFYAWTAALFAEDTLKETKNQTFNSDIHFSKLKQELSGLISERENIYDRVIAAQNFFLKKIHSFNANIDLLSAINDIICCKGSITMQELSRKTVISSKQLERLFHENIGVQPKVFSDAVRYQLLWQDMIYNPNYNALDAVYKYGYYDQSHLLHDFYKHHLMSPKEALSFAHHNR